MTLESKYQPISADETEATSDLPHPHYRSIISNLYETLQNSVAFLLGVLLAIVLLIILTSPATSLAETYPQRKTAILKVSSCGESVAEAKQLGCVYDPGLLYWTQPYCRAEDIADEFVRNPVHEIFRDKEKLQPLNLSYITSGEFGAAYDRVEHHKGHCLNAWKVLTQSAGRFNPSTPEVLLPGMAVSWSHVVHCSDDVVVPNEKSKWRTKPYIKFWPGVEGCYLMRAPASLAF
ncbi:hypothetical protein LZ31DRAFT_636816 [Colletotrichum somersetense]|nr:hypothetical protein LZ31DRAFT_636816 [Colletotrichum somersetense]